MKKQNLIHVKLNNDELVESKKEILSTQADLIKILQIIKKYKALRIKELKLKTRLARKLKETRLKINKLEQTLPHFEVSHESEEKLKKGKAITKKDTLEVQLEEIQKKLRELEK